MAVKASATITISKYRDTDSITRYYKLVDSTASAPAVPTILNPTSWDKTEPDYTSGSTSTLYYTDCIIFSDGTFQYTDDGTSDHKAIKSSSYEAAKEAYNKAQAAQNTANNADTKADNVTGDLQGYKQTNDKNYGTAMQLIDSMNKLISSLAIDETGTGTYMDQTTGTFTFTLGDIVNSLQQKINSETYDSDKSETQGQISNIMGRAGNLELKTAQIQISKDDTGSPVMLFGSTDSKFKVRITNKSIDFMYDAIILAYANHETFNSDVMAVNRELQNILSSTITYNSSSNGTTPPTDGWQNEIPEEIQSGNYLWIKTVKKGFVWKTRKNGNMSLTPFESESNIAEEIKNE